MNNALYEPIEAFAIQKIMSSYCRFVDTKDWDGLKSILVKNINFTFQNESGIVLYTFNSRKSFLLACVQGIGNATTAHHLHNPEINLVNKNEADGVWAMEDRFYLPANATQPTLHGYGHYHVRFQRRSGNWQIENLVLTRVRLVIADK
jgi:hypothetical protein